MNIQENISLRGLNTFGIAKNARFFTVVASINGLKEALAWAKKTKSKGSDPWRRQQYFIDG
ncbi:hypothetical protein [Algoriphagus boritolerans]|uniref:hypothetical protein n=1 Tax=Algoriphagus boritolerans TaxID=308111 RepID=UPI000B1DCFB9